MTAYCETCRQTVESVNEADQCEECHDAWGRKLDAACRDLYEGERRAGLHGEFTEEGLEMRRRDALGAWMEGMASWGSREIAQYVRGKDK